MSAPRVSICAIAGGSGSGKTTLALALLDLLGDQASHHTIDWYYRDLSHLSQAERDAINFDHPDSLEVDLFVEHLGALSAGRSIDAPVYDFESHTRVDDTRRVESRPVIVAEGIHLLALEAVRNAVDLMVFIDVPAATRLERRVRRDVVERGRTPESVRHQWQATVAPMHDRFVEPSKLFADRIVTNDESLDEVAATLAAELTNG